MSSGITLTAGVRQNLLSLQNTADLMATTQQRLATGKKVNSALDNPSNFFTSQSLNDRASDLNALLDSIGQATQTLDAANNGITSITQLVQSAKSIAQQARQSTVSTDNFGAVDVSGTVANAPSSASPEVLGSLQGTDLSSRDISLSFTNQAETIGAVTGTSVGGFGGAGSTVDTGNDGNIVLTINNGSATSHDVSIAIATTDTIATTIGKINAAVDAGGSDANEAGTVHASNSGGHIALTALGSNVDFSIKTGAGGSTANTLTATGLATTSGTGTSTSLLDNIVAAGGSAGASFSLTTNGGSIKTFTFDQTGGANTGQTIGQFNTWLNANGGGTTATISGTTFSLLDGKGAGNTLKLDASSAAVKTALGLGTASTAVHADGTNRGGLGTSSTSLTRTYNSDVSLSEIDPTNLANGENLTVSIDKNDGNGSQAQVISLSGSDNLASIAVKLQGNNTISNNISVTTTGGKLKLAAKTADVDFTVGGSDASVALGLTDTNAHDSDHSSFTTTGQSKSLLDNIVAAGGAIGQTLTIQANSGAVQTITFGQNASAGQVSTLDELNSALGGLGGVTASVTGSSIHIGVAAGSTATSIKLGGDSTVINQLGLSAYTGETDGTKSAGTPSATRASLQNDFNNVLDQIDALTGDASYNGINLLNGDDLKVTFNETGSSSLTIKGVTFNSTNLGLNKLNGTQFQDNTSIDTITTATDAALSTLRTQASKFGSTLTTVQTRQDFTKNMINTLQTGADNLVLADSNEEGANMLALQTRQQLSTTALSLANQASQAVLRLFG
jgi:flagellin-like hook-associated protein FlgL